MRKILSHKFALLGDLKNWFYQIKTPRRWWRWFAVRVAAGRGRFEVRTLRVLSMGLALSVFIAHSFALEIARRAAHDQNRVAFDAWVDNLIWLADVPEDLDSVTTRLAALSSQLQFVGSMPPVRAQEFVFVGIHFDLKTGTAKVPTPVGDRLRANLNRLNARLTLRDVLSVIGLLLFFNFAVTRCPMAFLENLLSFLRQSARKVLHTVSLLDESVDIPTSIVEDIAILTDETLNAKLTLEELDRPFERDITLFSDASNAALAAVFRQGHVLTITAWEADPSLQIFAKEALALLLGLSVVPRLPPSIGAGIDNANLAAALRKGHSRSPDVNRILRHIFRLLARQKTCLWTALVSSEEMLADFPSRGRPLPSNALEYFTVDAPLLQVPFWLPPRSDFAADREEEEGGVSMPNGRAYTQLALMNSDSFATPTSDNFPCAN
jgi:hypothetical protein